jgi:hypothetical protein
MRTELILPMPLTITEIRRKVAAWKELYGAEPRVQVTGYLTTAEGETVFAMGHFLPVTSIGSKYLYATVDRRRTAIRPNSVSRDSFSTPGLVLDQKR